MTGSPPCCGDGVRAPVPHRPPRCHTARLAGGQVAVEISPDEALHLDRVLRLRPGAAVEVFDGCGRSAAGRIEALGRGGGRVLVDGPVIESPPRAFEGVLVQAMPKGEKKDLIVQKAVELGLGRLVFLEAERSVARIGADDAARRKDRWMRVAVAAAKQCGCDRLPAIGTCVGIDAALAAVPSEVRILCETLPGARPLREIVRAAACRRPGSVTVFVGPEGGFSPGEVRVLLAAGAQSASLGPHVLRTETAALLAMSVMLYEFGTGNVLPGHPVPEAGAWQSE